MEIQKAKELRDQLEDDILNLIQKFEEETKTYVQYVSLDAVHILGDSLPNTVKVQVEFKF